MEDSYRCPRCTERISAEKSPAGKPGICPRCGIALERIPGKPVRKRKKTGILIQLPDTLSFNAFLAVFSATLGYGFGAVIAELYFGTAPLTAELSFTFIQAMAAVFSVIAMFTGLLIQNVWRRVSTRRLPAAELHIPVLIYIGIFGFLGLLAGFFLVIYTVV